MTRMEAKIRDELLGAIEGLPPDYLKEVLDFVYFQKVKVSLNPDQAYFWTKQWQALEKKVNKDKSAKKIIGNGTPEGLVRELNS